MFSRHRPSRVYIPSLAPTATNGASRWAAPLCFGVAVAELWFNCGLAVAELTPEAQDEDDLIRNSAPCGGGWEFTIKKIEEAFVARGGLLPLGSALAPLWFSCGLAVV